VPYLREGLDRGETVVAVVSDAAEQILRSALGGDTDQVQWRAGEVSYQRLGAMFEGFRQFLADQRAAGAQVRLLTQNDAGGGPDRVGAYLRNEAMTNEVYRPYGYPWACLYDRRAHTEETLRQVRQVHPRLLEPGGAAIPSTTYVTPADFVAGGAPPAPVPPVVELDVELTGAGELVRLRRLLGRWAGGHGDGGGDPDDVMSRWGRRSPTPCSTVHHRSGSRHFQTVEWPGYGSTTSARRRCSRPPATTAPTPQAVAASDSGLPVNSPTSSPSTSAQRGRPSS
jgi:hypothetical protein